MLKSANDTAIRRVLTPAMRTEYASVPTRWMTKVKKQIMTSWASIRVGSPLTCSGFNEPNIPHNALEACRLRKVRIHQINEIRIEVTVMDSDADPIRLERLIIEDVTKVGDARQALEPSIIRRQGEWNR